MKAILIIAAAFLMGLLTILESGESAFAQRRARDWPDSGYCPTGSCGPNGGKQARDVKMCSPANCRKH